MAVWGVHNDQLATEPVTGGFVSIGWHIGDVRQIGLGQEAIKAALADPHPDDKPRAIAGWAGVILRFAEIMREADVIVAPYRPDSTINLGVVTGPYEYHPEVPTHRHRRLIGRAH